MSYPTPKLLRGPNELSFDVSMESLLNSIDAAKFYITVKRALDKDIDYSILGANVKEILRACHDLKTKFNFEAAYKNYETGEVTFTKEGIATTQQFFDILNDIAAIGLFLRESDESKSESENERNQILLAMTLKAIRSGRKLREVGLQYKLDLVEKESVEFERIIYELIPGFREYKDAESSNLDDDELQESTDKWNSSQYLQLEYSLEGFLRAETVKKVLNMRMKAYARVAEQCGTEEHALELLLAAKQRAYDLVWSNPTSKRQVVRV